MSRLAVTAAVAIAASIVLPVAAAWAASSAGAAWWLTAAVTNVVTAATFIVSIRAVRRAGERARAEIRADAERECAEIRRRHGGQQ